ncbi:DnaB-like helicase C-terminal domain-containing protein [Streptomyces sp. NPDC002769]|uniref:DnaB-like helicase C-terminal domain-containing protein n=1 Tax=Streptomyces sp. NPDC002769 TaxID=3154542 RepID=UPI0033324EFD
MNASDARRDLYALVKRANDDGVTTLIHRGSKQEDRVLLAPLDRFPAARKADAFPSWVLSAAQKDFGTLIGRAVSGQPQVLRRNSTPVAVLLPADGPISSTPSDTAAHTAATAGGVVTSQPTRDPGRRLATLGDALGDVITSGSAPGLSFGLAGLDAATGGLHPGRLVLIAAPPQVGGSLIGLSAARHTALALNSRVLYAASGPNRADITRRIIAAEAGGDYARLKTGTLTPHEQEVVQRLRNAPLLIDDGSDLTAEAIAETVPVAGDLALVVVDRLQRARNPRLPLSGEHLPAASQVLRELARTQHVPVLAVLDTDDPAIVNLLDADVILTLTAHPDTGETNVTVAERDLGIIGHARLRPDLAHARFLDTPTVVGTTATAGTRAGSDTVPDTMGSDTVRELAAAALPFTSGALQGLPAEATHLLAALRTALAAGNIKDLDELHVPLRALAAAGLRLPDHTEGRRLAAALHAYNAPAPVAVTAQPSPTEPARPAAGSSAVADTDDEDRRDDDGLVPGDEEDEPQGAVFPALRILKDSVTRSKMHPVPVIRKEDREDGPWPLISEDMDGEPRWIHPDVTSTRVAHVRGNGKRVRRDQLDVPDTFGDGVLCLIDRNGSFPSACSAVPLAPNKLLHTGPLDAFDRGQAGIYQIGIPEWDHPGMPHPLGRLIDRPDEQGRVWVTTPHLKQLERLHREGHLAARVAIHDSWTGKANESLFKPFYTAAREARTELIQAGGQPYKDYKTRLSIALRLLWPKRPDSRSPFWRPDWRMSMVAEASVRHWLTAFKAVQEGHTLIALRNVDAAIFWTPDQTPPDTYRVGTGFGQVKAKFIQPGDFIPEGDD